MSDFKPFAAAVKAQFDHMSKGELYTVGFDGDQVYSNYLKAFPEGTNEIYRERTEHDCSCCKNFIRNIGNVVSIVDGALVSVWDAPGLEFPYSGVAATLSNLIKLFPVMGLFRATEPTYGAESSKEIKEGSVRTWNHFHAAIAAKHYVGKNASISAASAIGNFATTVGVFKRGLDEFKPEHFSTVIDLIDSNAIYRGAEHRASVVEFMAVQAKYLALGSGRKNLFLWENAGSPVARFRNTVIGTLLQDLAAGDDIERAVKAFETKVAPQNYKRPTALITEGMKKQALATIAELGLEPALSRRFARLSDVSVNNVLWVNGAVQGKMKDGIEGLLDSAIVKAPAKTDGAMDIGIDQFMATVLPQATDLQILVRNNQQGNFMSLTAPVHSDVPQLFKWSNNFGWSYDGNIADSIKERVKAAGGTVEGDLCCRLAWEYTDDLDFYMYEPGGGHIYFGNRRQLSANGGMLDVDANGMDGQREDPSENIFYKDRSKMRKGAYKLVVNNYNRRSNGAGFEVEIEFDGQVVHFEYAGVVPQRANVAVAIIHFDGVGFRVQALLPASTGPAKGVDKWGVTTEQFVKVNTVMFSPNYWDDNATGNKHWFFLLDQCKNPLPARGIYNEFLASGLEAHRKVFEVLAERMKCAPTDDQLSGVGFSSTKGDSVIVSVVGDKLRKTYNINF